MVSWRNPAVSYRRAQYCQLIQSKDSVVPPGLARRPHCGQKIAICDVRFKS